MKYLRGCLIEQKELADAFYEAYERCFEEKNTHIDEYNRIVSHIVAIPGFVNGLFACELYFKYLLGNKVNNLEVKDRHNLKSLFDNLDDTFKNELNHVKCDSRYTLEGLLESIGDGFVKWRYIFEDGNESFGNDYPFEYTEYFLETYLPIIKTIATKNYNKNKNLNNH